MFSESANLSPILRSCSQLYAELIRVGIDPLRADGMELWQIAALQSQHSEQSSDPDTESMRIMEARVQAAREGRELTSDEVFV